ncbi:VacJ family lipoprotein [Pseudoxanthomonas sp. J35]|uniref:MlaA family lipoprotein n=1 Tax=Pseudoxanthomonas sp. J35 TaxID=935852 RepID=UPI00048D9A95|nr:VacJ family lipoprotein [Pseudoxanthomonas sp. J35]
MNARALILFPMLLALAACASGPKPSAQAAAPVAVAGEAAGPAQAGSTLPAPSAAEAAAATDPAVATEPAADDAIAGPVATDADAALAPTDEEDDYAALYGEDTASGNGADGATGSVPYDPWEPMNRRIHAFNNVVDRAIARPIARAYVTVVPQPVRLGVTNFFDNLSSPLTMVNQVLQGRPRDAVQTFGRFLVNSTLGIGGIFDPASDLKMKRRSEDFGQTLGIWGWRSSRYVELPFFGPRTLRDVVGLAGDAPLSVVQRIEEDKVRIALQGAQLVDTRAQLLAVDALRDAAPDEYAITRDAWIKRRTFKIESDRRSRDGNLRDEEDDDRHPTVPADAMPLPVMVP